MNGCPFESLGPVYTEEQRREYKIVLNMHKGDTKEKFVDV